MWCRSAWDNLTHRETGMGDISREAPTSQGMSGSSCHTEHAVPAFEAGELEGKLLLQAETQLIFKGMVFFFP